MKSKEQYHQITIDEYLEIIHDLEEKRKAVTQDINFLEADLQREVYLNKIKELKGKNRILIEMIGKF